MLSRPHGYATASGHAGYATPFRSGEIIGKRFPNFAPITVARPTTRQSFLSSSYDDASKNPDVQGVLTGAGPLLRAKSQMLAFAKPQTLRFDRRYGGNRSRCRFCTLIGAMVEIDFPELYYNAYKRPGWMRPAGPFRRLRWRVVHVNPSRSAKLYAPKIWPGEQSLPTGPVRFSPRAPSTNIRAAIS